MTEQELIEVFKYNGYDISKYSDNISIVSIDGSKYIDKRKKAIATTSTFSCTNLLAYSSDFAYLVHMYPSEMVGDNNAFDNRLNELNKLLKHFQSKELNILISLGESVPNDGKRDFHDFTHIVNKLKVLGDECEKLGVNLNVLKPTKSKYLLFDLENSLLYIDNPNKQAVNINTLERKPLVSIPDDKKVYEVL